MQTHGRLGALFVLAASISACQLSEPSSAEAPPEPADAKAAAVVRVDAHGLKTLDAEQVLTESEEDLAFFVEAAGKRPRNVATVYSTAWNATQLDIHLKKPREQVNGHARMSLEAAIGVFQLAYGDPKEIVLQGETLRYEQPGPDDHAHAQTWLRAACLAVLLDDQKSLDRLLQVPTSDLRRSKTGIADFRNGVVDVFRMVLQDQDTPDAYRAVYAQIAADQSDSGYVSIPITFVDALIAVTKKDEAALAVGLEQHLQAHRRYWTSERWANNPEGLASITGSALVKLAEKRGLRVNVESDYLLR